MQGFESSRDKFVMLNSELPSGKFSGRILATWWVENIKGQKTVGHCYWS